LLIFVICLTLSLYLQNGLTPVHLAAQEDKVNVAEVLVKYESEIDPQTKVGIYIHISPTLSDCCLTPTQQFFSYIMARTS
jgi:hypothetical protein